MPEETKKRGKNRSEQLANAEIDRRLAEAIKERTKLHKAVSRMMSAQERLSRVEQEINSLVQLRQRLNGSMPELPATPVPFEGFPIQEMPAGISSIPTRQPKATTENVAQKIAQEGGFL